MFHNFRINRIEENSNFSELTFAKYVEMSLHILHCYLLLWHFMLQTVGTMVWYRHQNLLGLLVSNGFSVPSKLLVLRLRLSRFDSGPELLD